MSRNTLSLRVIALINALGMAAFFIFSRIYFNQFLSESKIGFLFSLSGFLIFLQPVWGILTDFFGSSRRMYQLVVTGAGFVFLTYYLGPTVFLENYWLLVGLFVALGFFNIGRGPIWNSMVLTFLEEEESSSGFGDIRLWFSLGWAVGAVLFGWYFLEGSLLHMFIFSSGLFFATGMLVFVLSETKRDTLNTVNVFKDPRARKLLGNRKVWIFLIALFVVGTGSQAGNTFLPIYLKEHFSMSTLVLGGVYAAGSLGEVPFFYYGEDIMDRMGIERFLLLGFTVQSVIWIFLSVVSAPHLAFMAWIVRGMGYSFVVLGSVLYLDHYSPAETRTIGQSLFTVTFFGLASIVGRIGGGFVAEVYGLSQLYLIAGLLGFVGIFGLGFNWFFREN